MMMMDARRGFLAAAGAGALLAWAGPSRAQGFPDRSRQIRGLSPFSVGSTADTLARAYAQAMSEGLGTSVFIDNRPGAEGVLAMQAAKAAGNDGYTILFTTLSTQVVNPHLFRKLPYDSLNDFVPLAGTMRTGLCLAVSPGLPFKSLREFVDAARAAPEKYSYASLSATTRVAGELVSRATGIKLLNVPYKSFGDLTSDLLSSRVDMLMIDTPSLLPFVKQGLRVMATASLKRSAVLPDVPTFHELGFPGFEISGWHAAYAPAKTPPEVVAVLRQALRRAVTSKPVQDYYARFGMEALELSGDELAAFQRTEYEKWGRAVRDAGLAGTL